MAGDLQRDYSSGDAVKLLCFRTLEVMSDLGKDWNGRSFTSFACLVRVVIESCADTCVIVCGHHKERRAKAFLDFYDQVDYRLKRILAGEKYQEIPKEHQDWLKIGKLDRVGCLQTNHGLTLGEKHDYRSDYDFLSAFVHTSPKAVVFAEAQRLKLMQAHVLAACCVVQCEHLIKSNLVDKKELERIHAEKAK